MSRRSVNGMFSTVMPSSLFPSTYSGFPEDMDDWVCGHWDSYYENNAEFIGSDEAMQLFNIDTGRVGPWANLELCKLDCNFVNKFAALGFNTTLLSDIYCGTGEIIEDVVDVADFAFLFMSTAEYNLGIGIYFS